MATKFTYNDTVRVRKEAPASCRPDELASVVGISLETERKAEYLRKFPHGVLYLIEFEDGSSVEISEDLLEKGAFPSELKPR